MSEENTPIPPAKDNSEKALELVKTSCPQDWKILQKHHQKLGGGERYSFQATRGGVFSQERNERVGLFVTFYENGTENMAFQDEDSLIREYEAVRHSMESTRKEASTYFNVIITLLSGSLLGLGFGHSLVLVLTGAFLLLLFIMNQYFKQVMYAKRLRLVELEKVLGFESLTIVGISRRTWLVKNTPYLVFSLFGAIFLVATIVALKSLLGF